MNSTKSKLLITAGLFAAVAVASGVSQRCSAQVTPDAPMFTGHPSTSWHTMRPVEKGWIGGMVISAANAAELSLPGMNAVEDVNFCYPTVGTSSARKGLP